jgi:hypothetical protein
MFFLSPRRGTFYVARDATALIPFGAQTFIRFTNKLRRVAFLPITLSKANLNSVQGYLKRYLAHYLEMVIFFSILKRSLNGLEKTSFRQNYRTPFSPTVPPFATGSARVVGDVEASVGESENV